MNWDHDVDMPEPVKVLVVGDLHGNSVQAEQCCEYAARHGCDAIVQVGDFGFWVPGDSSVTYLKRVEKAAREFGLIFYWLDGNHEDHSRRHEFDSKKRPRTRYLPRGHRWSWWGKRFMAVGGAVSVDKHFRTDGKSWWPEEVLSDAEVDYACRDDGTPVDVVFSHDCPRGVDIPGVGRDTKSGVRGSWPQDILLEAEVHRTKLLKIWEATHPRMFIHGHYHIPYQQIECLDYEHSTGFCGLGCDGDKMMNVAKVLKPEDLDVSVSG